MVRGEADVAAGLSYSRLDRFVHRIAFAAPAVQLAAADIEESLFKADFAHLDASRPLFITSLPRAGTTVLLEALSALPGMATHRYRDMPFVMAPLIWSRISSRFRISGEKRERAHGDGIYVDYDSPEAFEEMIWRAFWPSHYQADRIELWHGALRVEEAAIFFRAHMRKIIALRQDGPGRYVSKNNGNIARLELLASMFPDAALVVPVRAPLDHAASLLRQHLNFRERHANDPFTRRYMRDIGHYEFGELHRPIAFSGLAERLVGRDPLHLDYWLAYWLAAFEHVLSNRERVFLLSHEGLRCAPRDVLGKLGEAVDLGEPGELARVAAVVRPPPGPGTEVPDADAVLVEEAEALYARLRTHALA